MALIKLTSIDHDGLILYSGRTDSQLRDGIGAGDPGGLFIAESMNVIERALASGIEPESLFVEEQWFEHERALVDTFLERYPDAPVFVATHEQFKAITGYQVTRGALAAFRRPNQPNLDELLDKSHRVAILEDITNYTNVGQIFRSAAALGIDAVILTPRCHDPLYRRAARVSMGTVFQVPWVRIDESTMPAWPGGFLDYLRTKGFKSLSLALKDDARTIDDESFRAADKLALILGTEGEGLTDETILSSDHCVIIPMMHGVDSLNVGAAAAVAFWELRNRF